MTGGSLGLRTGSYGSLQQHLQNNAFLPIHTTPFVVRKPSKMLLSSIREKERFLPRICKVASRRGVGMLLVVVLSVLVFMSVLSAVSKDEDTITDAESHSRSTLQVPSSRMNSSMSSIDPDPDPETFLISEDKDNNKIDVDQDKKNDNIPFLPNNIPMSGEKKAQLPPILVGNAFPSVHPCDKFVLPSSPPDRKRTGPRPCPVCYLPVEQAIARMPIVPSASPVLRNLTYVYEESLVQTELFGGSDFGGYPSLQQRNDSFDIKESMNVHCGFVNGSKPGRQTGFDIDDADLLEMEQCFGVVVASAIFGNYDIIQQPRNISEAAKTNVCFYLFVDEETEAYIRNSTGLDDRMKVGIWRVVVVRNLPYVDARRNGKYMDGPSAIISFFAKQTSSLLAGIKFVLMHDKCSELIPKLLLHRIFSNVRYSIWIDGKLQLVVDPYQVLERFLWRKNASFAISRHYRRFDVFEEAEANKAAGKYDNTSINFQVEFYRREGLTPYSEAKLPITSDVPEGCVIIKEHIPITNLFTCLWFNEVDRFTSRDQISFSTVRDKIMSKVNWGVQMFLDCERRNFVVQGYHKDLLEHMNPPPILNDERIRKLPMRSSTAIIIDRLVVKAPIRKLPTRRGRDRKSGPRRHRKTSAGIRDSISI